MTADIVYIKENALIAKMAAVQIKKKTAAIVIGKTIYLHNTSRENFLQNTSWVKHELAHIAQYKQYGIIKFILLYLFESIKNGYQKNCFELQAIKKENEELDLNNFIFK